MGVSCVWEVLERRRKDGRCGTHHKGTGSGFGDED